ncbi:uncharacterized protein RCH25_017511 [Pelodytes ibericus]
MDIGQIAQEVCVKAAVGFWQAEGVEQKDKTIRLNEDGKSLIFIDKVDAETKEYHFTFDGVFNFIQDQDKGLSELVQSTLHSVASGYNVSILLCGVENSGMDAILRGNGNQLGLIFKIIEHALQGVHPTDQEESMVTVAFMQFNADGKAMDLFNPSNQDLSAVYVSTLGMLMEGSSEIIVDSPEAAYSLYLHGKHDIEDASYCTLFKITVERSEREANASRVRSMVKIFTLSGKSLQTNDNMYVFPQSSFFKALMCYVVRGPRDTLATMAAPSCFKKRTLWIVQLSSSTWLVQLQWRNLQWRNINGLETFVQFALEVTRMLLDRRHDQHRHPWGIQ